MTEIWRAGLCRIEAVRDHEHGCDSLAHELEAAVEPLVLRAREDDDRVGVTDLVLGREEDEPHRQHDGAGGEQHDADEDEAPEHDRAS